MERFAYATECVNVCDTQTMSNATLVRVEWLCWLLAVLMESHWTAAGGVVTSKGKQSKHADKQVYGYGWMMCCIHWMQVLGRY